MKRFLSSVALCGSLLLTGLFFFMSPASEAQTNVLPMLLELPAPPPPNPFFRPTFADRDESFFDKKTPPADDAPTDDLIAYWKHQNQFDAKYGYVPKPSGKTLERLMSEAGKNPELLAGLVDVFPETPEAAAFVKRLYDEEMTNRKFEESWRAEVKKWLTYHTPYFSNELYGSASQAADTKEYVTNQDEVLALARVDWERAKPILDRMLSNSSQPVSQTLARWAYYKHAIAVNDTFDIEKYRKELQETVENKSLQPGNRDLAMDALVESGDFPGRDEWYFSLLEDETLHELRVNGSVYTGLTTIINHSPDDKYVAKMIELAASGNQSVRNAAVRNLSTLLEESIARKNPEIVRALVPWLENPKWAKEVSGERMKILTALRTLAIPESVPGLIAMLNEKEQSLAYIPDVNANASMPSFPSVNSNAAVNVARTSNYRTQPVESYPFRSYAVMALEKQKSPQAASALRTLLPVVQSWERPNVVKALLASQGFSIGEQLEALEEAAKKVSEEERQARINAMSNTNTADSDVKEILMAPPIGMTNTAAVNVPYNDSQPYNPNQVKTILGNQLVNLEEPSDALVKAVIDRINFHEKKNPQIASGMRAIIQNWKGAAINALLLRDLKDGRSNVEAIVKLLTIRRELREKQLADVTDIRAGRAAALGIAACLLEETGDYDAILDGGGDESKTALLACARLIRAALPVAKVAENLKSPNKLLALAAERYLEAEDSPEARRLVLARHPNEARILGARTAFVPESADAAGFFSNFTHPLFASVDSLLGKFPPYYFYDTTDKSVEKKLREEIKSDPELFGVYAYHNNYVRIYKDKAVFRWEDDPARYRERVLTAEEFDALKNYLAAQRVDELPPFLSVCAGCESKELLMLGKAGGRRVFVKAEPLPEFFAGLEAVFNEFRQPPAAIHYHLEKEIAGLEVLFADDNLKATTVWKDGADFRLLVDDRTLRRQYEKEAEETVREEYFEPDVDAEEDAEENVLTPERKAEMEKAQTEILQKARQKAYGSYTWFKFDKTRPLEPATQPATVEFIPPVDGFAVPAIEHQWKARGAGVEVRTGEDGLYRIKNGQLTSIGSGIYQNPLVTPNGRWVVGTKFSADDAYLERTYRLNLLTGKEYTVKSQSDYEAPQPVAFIAPLIKVLLFGTYGESENLSAMEGDFFLLDAETGVVQPIGAQPRVLLQQTFRPLQATAANGEMFWAALPDTEKNATQFGVFNARTLAFKPLLQIPQIAFDSMSMWVDERENKVYFTYEGHLLALPLPKNR